MRCGLRVGWHDGSERLCPETDESSTRYNKRHTSSGSGVSALRPRRQYGRHIRGGLIRLGGLPCRAAGMTFRTVQGHRLPVRSSSLERAVGKRKRPRGGGLSLALDGPREVHAQGRRIRGGCPRGTLRKRRSEGYRACTLFQSCFVKKRKWFPREARRWSVVSAQHSN
jgi:hypothetical protein